MASHTDSDDFGLSSSDEAEMLKLEVPAQRLLKRKSEEVLVKDSKRPRNENHMNAPSSPLTIARKVLKERFGMQAFRLKQEEAIVRLLQGESAVVVFPTGGGKSLCYQVPALSFKELDKEAGMRQGPAESGITLVVSPLIALMKDQVDALNRRGISAAALDSTKSREEYLATVDAMRDGTLDILYCAPERLNNEGFVASMANVKGGVRLLAVDEAHCISEWGHAFRPDYLKVARFAKEIQAERVICLTATATREVAKDVCRAFNIPEAGLFRTSTYRPNLRLQAQSFETKKESYPKLQSFLRKSPGPTIIYVTLQKHSEDLSAQLRQKGFEAEFFHAGMVKEEKTRVQEKFMRSNSLIIVATIAFGMGIDKANIRNVIHYDVPRSLEGYSQEIGRAGRDGLESHCLLYLCAEDLHLRESFARGDLPSKKSVQDLLQDVFASNLSDGFLEVSLYNQSREHDIKTNVLNNIYAQLELRFESLRATTPKYTKYSYVPMKNITDTSPAAKAIHSATKKAKKYSHVDIDIAAQKSGLPRADLVAKLNSWHDERLIDLQVAGVINIFRILKDMPKDNTARQKIIDALYKDLVNREQQELQRINSVIDLITGTRCFAASLAQHFGDILPGGNGECGNCTYCETKTPVTRVERPRREWDSKAFFAVLEACPDRDDPRYLARVAFGISSPRIAQARLGNSPVFGSMEDHDFMSLLKAFEKVCKKG